MVNSGANLIYDKKFGIETRKVVELNQLGLSSDHKKIVVAMTGLLIFFSINFLMAPLKSLKIVTFVVFIVTKEWIRRERLFPHPNENEFRKEVTLAGYTLERLSDDWFTLSLAQ